ncbi:hemerythrin-like metal-binding domain protein [Campylobacter sp. RM16704]|uniref:hemerythrin-like metal-binding domain protein n=1 Tax=Campylobacter sp. RM16704 TaxID=1500960 RepID=UPI00057D3125|nr:hemerythrin-like metal-binding domain protein [Campylobacter sp. RM16704]AJC86314.1 hemerythrin-like metal-binding domain protein [Campylobacter sp. RM16704]
MIKWANEYSVHNKTIDDQHKALFEIAKKAYFMTENHASINEIRSVLIELFEYVKTHFKDEENYMEKIGYPDLARHKKIHREITNSLIVLVKNIKTVNEFKEKLNIITEKWLLEHILKEDMKYHTYEKQKLKEKEYTFEEDIVSTEPIFEEFAPKYVVYVCGCINEKHKISYRLHQQILKGVKYNCKFCKKIIHPEREF